MKKTKSLRSLGEFGLINLIDRWTPTSKSVVQGIGDDAAVFRARRGTHQLLAIDTIVEDVDFKRSKARPDEIGRKALAVNLSDIAAMGGTPKLAVVSLTAPKTTTLQFMKGFYRGLDQIAKRYSVVLAGGDLSSGKVVSCSVAILGESAPSRVVYRHGAKVGDLVGVTGRLGGSILGHHLHFMPRVEEGLLLAQKGVSAMIDVSDGLVQDLHHLISRSRLKVALDESKVPISRAARRLAKQNGKQALYHALYDGEDFELLFTIAPKRYQWLKRAWRRRFHTPLTVIGQVVKGKVPVGMLPKKVGYQHF